MPSESTPTFTPDPVDAVLRARLIRMEDRVALGRDRADAMHGVVREPDEVDARQRRDDLEASRRHARLHAVMLRIRNLDGHARRTQAVQRVVGHLGEEQVHLHAGLVVDPEATGLHRVQHRLGRRAAPSARVARGLRCERRLLWNRA